MSKKSRKLTFKRGDTAYGSNDLAAIAPILLMRGAVLLRKMLMMPRLAMFDVSPAMAQQGMTVNVEVPVLVPAQDVNVDSENSSTAIVPTVIPVTLDNWKEAKFGLSDVDMMKISQNTLPESAAGAIYSLADAIDQSLLAEYKSVYQYAGTAGSTPDGLEDIAALKKVLVDAKVPAQDRFLLIDSAADEKYSVLDYFVSAEKVGDDGTALREASLGKKLTFNIFVDQNMPYHTKGTLALTSGGAISVKTTYAAGLKTVVLDDADGAGLTGTLVKGDIISFANHSQKYTVTSNPATASGNEISVSFEPALQAQVTDGVVVTILGSHRVNLGFHSQAFCFASRQLTNVGNQLGSIVQSISDPETGITLRLEIKRKHKAVEYSYDVLWGAKCVYPERAARLLG